MPDLAKAQRQFLELRAAANSAQLATLNQDRQPEASHAPVVCFDGHWYFFLSELASHTLNLMRNPALGLILVDHRDANANPFALRRISLVGSVQPIARDQAAYGSVLAVFRDRFGEVMDLIEPLPDFHLFRFVAEQGRFIRGFGQAYDLAGENLDRLQHVDPRG